MIEHRRQPGPQLCIPGKRHSQGQRGMFLRTYLMSLSALLPTLTAVPTISCLLGVSRCSPMLKDSDIPNAAWVNCRSPAAAQSVKIAAADATMRDLDIDVGLLPRLGLVTLPFHVTLDGAGVET